MIRRCDIYHVHHRETQLWLKEVIFNEVFSQKIDNKTGVVHRPTSNGNVYLLKQSFWSSLAFPKAAGSGDWLFSSCE